MKTYSRKQAGVIYRAIKTGKIEMSKAAISEMYDMVGEVEVYNTNSASSVQNAVAAIRNAVEFIFNGDYESAQVSINNFMAA